MNLDFLDWLIVGCLFGLMAWAAHRTKKYSCSVADFLVANRCAGRYVLAVSDGAASMGTISIIAMFEAYYASGFTFVWWSLLMNVVVIVIALSGWIQYRFRQTRALTMAQFLEMRYSRNFRIYAGVLAFISGTLNFGIFPGVGAKFFEYYCGFTPYMVSVGFTQIDLTYAAIMAVLITAALVFTFMGGQITIMITEFIQGTVLNITLAVILLFLLLKFPWSNVMQALGNVPPNQSMLNPFESSEIRNFNMWYYLIQAFAVFWCFMAWQGNQGYSGAALNAHEARMGKALGQWRAYTQNLVIIFLPICAYTVLHHSDWTVLADKINVMLNGVSEDPGSTMRKQLTTSISLTHILPSGLLGAFCAVMLSAFLSVQQTYMHSWGSIFMQDVILPFRKQRLTPRVHIRLLRLSILGVAVFVFLFSLFYSQNDAILMFFALTGVLFLGGGGTVIALGLYWRRGTTAAAYAAMSVGIVAFATGYACQKFWPAYHNGNPFPVNSQYMFFCAMMLSIVLYVLISLLGKKQVYDLDRLLHRGKYSLSEDEPSPAENAVTGIKAIFGISRDFTRGDKIIYWSISIWTMFWAGIFVVGVLCSKFFRISISQWGVFWQAFTWMVLMLVSLTTVWFLIGGLKDIKKMLHRLSIQNRDDADNGESGQTAGSEALLQDLHCQPSNKSDISKT